MVKKPTPMGVEVYKVVDVIDGKIKTLFHEHNGSKVLPVGEWLMAKRKMVRDGSSSAYYVAGWHVFVDLDDANRYLATFKNLAPKAIAQCRACGLRDKAHSRSPVKLANALLVEELVWQQGE